MPDTTDTLLKMLEESDLELMESEDFSDDPNEDTKVGAVVARPSVDSPLPGIVSEVRQAGYVTLYDTRTNEPRKIHRNSLGTARRKVHKDPAYPAFVGKPLFARQPNGPYVLGGNPCWLFPGTEDCAACGKAHPASDHVEVYVSWGLKPCMSAHLASEYEVEQHMMKRHKSEHGAIMADRERRREAARDKMQLDLIKAQEKVATAMARQSSPAPRNRRAVTPKTEVS